MHHELDMRITRSANPCVPTRNGCVEENLCTKLLGVILAAARNALAGSLTPARLQDG
jgi:hypothetical protein